MNHQTEIQDLIRWSVNKMEHLGWRKVIESNLIARLRGGLGGSHTVVTYPPLDALEPILPDQVISRSGPVSGLDLYLHIPFCEFICPFCHYDTQPTNINKPQEAKIQNYINALHEEVASWKGLIGRSTLNSIYIGGGTPTAISEEQLLSLLDSVSSLPRKQNFVGCVETSPLTVTAAVGRRKLQSLLNKGINRLSMGVQSFNSELLRCSRGYDLKTVLKSLEIVQALIDNLNIDLIQDLPNQTDEDLLTDLEYVDKIKPAQVTWYIMRLRPESRWYRRYQGSSLNISESSQSIRRTLMIRQGMERIGYLAMPGGRFIRERRYRDTFKDSRAGLNSVLLGCGLSAYSHGWDYIFRNTYTKSEFDGLDDYIERIRQHGFAIAYGLPVDELEKTASAFVSGIRSGVSLPNKTPATVHYVEEAAKTLHALKELGLVEINSEGRFLLTELGSLFEEEICCLFYSPEILHRIEKAEANRSLIQLTGKFRSESKIASEAKVIDDSAPYAT